MGNVLHSKGIAHRNGFLRDLVESPSQENKPGCPPQRHTNVQAWAGGEVSSPCLGEGQIAFNF